MTRGFADDPAKQQQWAAFVIDLAVQPGPLSRVIDDLAAFLIPHAAEARALDL